VLVDFSSPAALSESLERAFAAGIPILVGTTGLDDAAEHRIAEAAREVAVLRAANTSLGVALLADLVERAARVLGPDDWDIEIVEAHHGAKVDVPSGTALMLGDVAARGRGEGKLEEFNRSSCIPRRIGAIGYSAIRGGTVAGDHDVMFLGPSERLILSHRAESRAIFAKGALTAARFLKDKPAGLYAMRDVIETL
jgi:4-hydroxy-tetrahydrodipicolinate reductase